MEPPLLTNPLDRGQAGANFEGASQASQPVKPGSKQGEWLAVQHFEKCKSVCRLATFPR